MIDRLGPEGILNKIGHYSLLTASNKGSWFLAVRRTTQHYGLPDALIVLTHTHTHIATTRQNRPWAQFSENLNVLSHTILNIFIQCDNIPTMLI